MYRIYYCLLGVLAAILLVNCHDDFQFVRHENPPEFPGTKWYQVREPEKFSWSSSALDSARYFSQTIGSKAVMILDNGRLIDAWGNTTQKYDVASIRKSYLASVRKYQNLSLRRVFCRSNPPE